MLRYYCLETGKDWADAVSWLMFACRVVTQESHGFSSADLIFDHTGFGPLAVIKDQFSPYGKKKILKTFIHYYTELMDCPGKTWGEPKLRRLVNKGCQSCCFAAHTWIHLTGLHFWSICGGAQTLTILCHVNMLQLYYDNVAFCIKKTEFYV